MNLLSFSNEVAQALNDKTPIIGFDASITPCGMPPEDTMNMILMLETITRNAGVVPAAIAIANGKIHIGASHAILEQIAIEKNCASAAYNDLAYVVAAELTIKATTTASIYAAHLAKLPIIVTSGLGGIHPLEHQKNLDPLRNVDVFSIVPVAVVCSGARSILDLPQTITGLEKQGIPIVGYQTNEFPACYSHSSGIAIKHRLNTPKEIATLIHTHHQLRLQSGIVIANPIPENAALIDERMPLIVKQAQKETCHINEKTITPDLLDRLIELTTEQHLHAHIEVMKSNTALAAEIAMQLSAQ